MEGAGSVVEERADGKDLILRHRLALARATSRVCCHLEAKGKRAEPLRPLTPSKQHLSSLDHGLPVFPFNGGGFRCRIFVDAARHNLPFAPFGHFSGQLTM